MCPVRRYQAVNTNPPMEWIIDMEDVSLVNLVKVYKRFNKKLNFFQAPDMELQLYNDQNTSELDIFDVSF